MEMQTRSDRRSVSMSMRRLAIAEADQFAHMLLRFSAQLWFSCRRTGGHLKFQTT